MPKKLASTPPPPAPPQKPPGFVSKAGKAVMGAMQKQATPKPPSYVSKAGAGVADALKNAAPKTKGTKKPLPEPY